MSEQHVQEYLQNLLGVLTQIDPKPVAQAIEWLREARDAGQWIYACGNGGAAAIASQMVMDIVKGGSYGQEKRFKMIGLSDNEYTLTAYANDVDYSAVYVEQLRNFAGPGDVLIAVSGSGNSPNVIKAVEYANEIGCRTIGLSAEEGSKLREIAQLPIAVPARHMGHLEDSFFIVTHILCYAFMNQTL
jgi:D-sedoheptulose 7-phosphate isomerase